MWFWSLWSKTTENDQNDPFWSVFGLGRRFWSLVGRKNTKTALIEKCRFWCFWSFWALFQLFANILGFEKYIINFYQCTEKTTDATELFL